MAEDIPAPRPDTTLATATETSLLAVHLAVAAGFGRLYDTGTFLGDLAGFVVLAHILTVVTRRRRIPTAVTVTVVIVGGVLASAWLLFPQTLGFGLPTGATASAARQALQVSREQFSVVYAPVPVAPGFQLGAGLALYLAVWFADWAAFRLRATAEALAPAAVLFVFASQFGSGQHTISSTLAFGVAALAFVVAHRAWQAETDLTWLAARRLSGARSVVRLGASLAVVGLFAGAVVGPRLPGNGDEPLLDWRSSASGTGDRSTVSPIVDLQKRLVNQSDTVLFTVKAERRAYWRLTSLDTFDGRIWRSDGDYATAEGRLPSGGPELAPGRRNRQQITIRSLSAIWAPSAFEARRVLSTSADLQWDDDSSTLIVDDRSPNSDGRTYQVISETPELDPAILERANPAEDRLPSRFRQLPDDFPDVARETARAVTQGATNRYQQALALQTFFRTQFDYSLEIPPGHGDDALVEFLDARVGYCEQFAGTYAAMARSIGMPARVAVGFTPGEVDPDDPTLFTVRGRHAHAWPEVWFPGAGWVAFEPTPGRGIPDSQSYTGVGEAQDDTRSDQTVEPASTTSTPTTTAPNGPSDGTPTTTAPDNPRVVAGAASDGPNPDGGGPVRTWLALGAGAVLAWVLVVLAAPSLRRRRRRRPDATPADAVLNAWDSALGPVRWLARVRPDPAETHAEFATRTRRIDSSVGEPLQELAALATLASWNPAVPTSAEVARAEALAADLHRQVADRQAATTRIRRRLSWREAFGTLG